MPWASRDTMAATGSPGIKRGRMKFSIKAKTSVTKNQSSLLRKYFRYPFNAAPPREYNRHYTYKVTVTWSDQYWTQSDCHLLITKTAMPRLAEHGCFY